ncbi:MAG: hypothetical protein RQ751_11530, partial [Longimicrobiales bacterium]|nr:hypothetical protein [Longimicrobiales bacterium]
MCGCEYRTRPPAPGSTPAGRRAPGSSLLSSLLVLLAAAAACDAPDVPPPSYAGEPGARLPGLDSTGLELFQEGARLFARQFTEAEGLGPRFNENSCNACHTFPVDGGTGETSVRRISRTLPDGACDPLDALSGSNLRIQVTGALAAAGGRPERHRPPATHTAVFTIPFT